MNNPKEKAVPMYDLKGFRVCNNLTQKTVSDFLGISVAFISAIERGLSRLPNEQLIALLNNDQGWDTKYLLDGDPARGTFINNGQVDHNVNSPENCEFRTYHGYTKEDVEREVYQKLAIAEAEIRMLKDENQRLSEDNAYLRSQNVMLTRTNERMSRKLFGDDAEAPEADGTE